jgi:hypothetical protein
MPGISPHIVMTDMGNPQDRRLKWELAELVAWALLGADALLGIAGLVAGFVANFGSTARTASVGQLLLDGTGWAGFVPMLLVLASLGMAWWQIQGWSEVVNGWIDDDSEAASDPEELTQAYGHMLRARRLAVWAGIVAVVISFAAVGSLIGFILTFLPFPRPDNQVWAELIENGGEVLASLLLGGAALFVAVWLLGLCRTALAIEDEDGEAVVGGFDQPHEIG